jgi:hypothetical protein
MAWTEVVLGQRRIEDDRRRSPARMLHGQRLPLAAERAAQQAGGSGRHPDVARADQGCWTVEGLTSRVYLVSPGDPKATH